MAVFVFINRYNDARKISLSYEEIFVLFCLKVSNLSLPIFTKSVKVTGRFRNNIAKGSIDFSWVCKKVKIWFKEFTVSDIYIGHK